jgi:hypothetical protein
MEPRYSDSILAEIEVMLINFLPRSRPATATLSNTNITHPAPSLQTALCRATPCYEPLRHPAAAGTSRWEAHRDCVSERPALQCLVNYLYVFEKSHRSQSAYEATSPALAEGFSGRTQCFVYAEWSPYFACQRSLLSTRESFNPFLTKRFAARRETARIRTIR